MLEIDLDTITLSGKGTNRVLVWAGAYIQEPHRALRTRFGISEPGVYVSRQNFGSPAQHFGIRGQLITEVDEQPTPNLDSFIKAVKKKFLKPKSYLTCSTLYPILAVSSTRSGTANLIKPVRRIKPFTKEPSIYC